MSFPTFAEFYAAANGGREPFPWQRRLAHLVVESGWPDEIGVPTGCGKTGCLDIAVWALAHDGRRLPAERRHPTRIWYVVNRRLLVDVGHEHALQLAELLRGAARSDGGPLFEVGEALRSRSGMTITGGPVPALHVSRLRGGSELGARPVDPACPALICATVPMFASRWLFRGYGTSRGMSPVDAALAGTDSLVLLDEAHLAQHLQRLCEPLAECDLDGEQPLQPARRRPHLVGLTATGDSAGRRFDLDDEDRANPTIAQRLAATKEARLVEVPQKGLEAALAEAAIAELSADPTRTGLVFVNSPKRALAVHQRLRLALGEANVGLLTGRAREPDADWLRKHLLSPTAGLAAGSRAEQPSPRCMVATQTLEVGADLDVDCVVTESAGRRAFVQRLGRLNRLGERSGVAVVCHPTDPKDGDPLYGDEPTEVADALRNAGPVDLGPARINEVLGPPADHVGDAAEILPSLLWEWAKTSAPPPGEAEVERYFSEPDDDMARIDVCWRTFLPGRGLRLWPAVNAEETVTLPIGELRSALSPDREAATATVERLDADRFGLEEVAVRRLRPGDVVVVPVSWGHYDQSRLSPGWDPTAHATVDDLSLRRTRHLLVYPGDVIESLLPEGPGRAGIVQLGDRLRRALEAEASGEAADDPSAVAAELRDTLRTVPLPTSPAAAETWAGLIGRMTDEAPLIETGGGDPVIYLRLDAVRRANEAVPEVYNDEEDDLCFLGVEDRGDLALLDQHLRAVGELAAQTAAALGLPSDLVAAVRRAGELHDVGKHDERFQWVLGRREGEPQRAKSAGREPSVRFTGWPRRARHELLSARLVDARWPSGSGPIGVDEELVRHLVISHHGHGRPWMPVVDDPIEVVTGADIGGERCEVLSSFALPEWEQPRHFRKLCERYGYWGLALLEAIVRQADHRASGEVANVNIEVA